MRRKSVRPYVLDSFAALAYLENETSAIFIRDLLKQARQRKAILWFSLINYGETLYIIERERGPEAARRTIGIIDQLPIAIADADRHLTFLAAHYKAQYPLSYADAFAAALAKTKAADLLTGDPEFKSVEPEISIHWLPK